MANNIKTMLLIVAMSGIVLWIGSAAGGTTGLLIALVIALAINFGSLWYSDILVAKMYGAKEVTSGDAPRLHEMVERLSAQAGIPKPRVLVVETEMPNAFATGRSPSHAAVAVTSGLLQMLDYDEVEGVVAHELAHIKNRDTLTMAVAGALATMIMFASRIAFFFGDRDNALGSLAILILGPIAAMLIQFAISRSREYEADAHAAKLSGNPGALAKALLKLENVNSYARQPYADPATAHLFIVKPGALGMLASLFSTHPPTAERVKRLQSMA